MSGNGELLKVEDLVVTFNQAGGQRLRAVDGVGFAVAKGETLGLVGESGCGKSSLARAVIQLPPPTSGRVLLDGEDLTGLAGEALRRTRRKIQMIFQDPISSLNPRRRIGDTVAQPLRIMRRGGRAERDAQACDMLAAVGLDPGDAIDRLPHQFSGGQCQRISIARALILEPEFLICDEPVSALDVSVQAQILNLLREMRARYGLTMLFISHDLAVVKNICDRVAVMYLAKLCEIGPSEELYRSPAHPYTAALLSAIPQPSPERRPAKIALVPGELPSPTDPPPGCRFHTRCPHAKAICKQVEPEVKEVGPGRSVACHFPL
ncbi:MAG: ATP-binding cassette domain-containing protein [Alphaproteobacteria bacterium]|nr:ATP-binding cassette domain-containing protein [Alphaproteobacteria bacterium]MDP6516415.1 ATP-binding cassette domain-containing protein [Alphaproteobacteria bacterium]